VLLKNKIFGRDIVFVGNDSRVKRELLWRFEGVGNRDQIGGETARQEIARRTGGEKEQADQREDKFLPHELGDTRTSRAAPFDKLRAGSGGQPMAAVPT
jgi:hypothetical protein